MAKKKAKKVAKKKTAKKKKLVVNREDTLLKEEGAGEIQCPFLLFHPTPYRISHFLSFDSLTIQCFNN